MKQYFKSVSSACSKTFIKVTDEMPDYVNDVYKNGEYLHITHQIFSAVDDDSGRNWVDLRISKFVVKKEEFELQKKVYLYIEISESEYTRAEHKLREYIQKFKSEIVNL